MIEIKDNIILSVVRIFIISFLMFTPIVVYGEEINNELEEKTVENEKDSSDNNKNTISNESKDNSSSDSKKATKSDGNSTEKHKAAVITTKVDENGDPLKGAVLQILDEEGNVLDEWTSDGTEHTTLLPEGDYVLHEKKAPEGYKLASDKPFKVEIEISDTNAGVDFSETPCPHYEGTPLYYVEIDGEKNEVYCINQDWETPDEDSIYDGKVLTPDDIRDYTKQTVFVDAHKNKGIIDVSDQTLSSEELYDKLLDIIYHRQKASEKFPDLSEAEIRYVTEVALKNYTNAGLTRIQGARLSQLPENYDSFDYYFDGNYTWYLYPWYRSYIYDPTAPLEQDIFTTNVGNGNAFGTLARHWSSAHNGKKTKNNTEEEVLASRQKVARFYELYLYLISDVDPHPKDMHLYIFSTSNKRAVSSLYEYDEGAYQNLLGIRWYNPYDEKHVVNLTYQNEKNIVFHEKEVKKKSLKKIIEKRIKKKKYKNPHTGDNIMLYMIMVPISLSGIIGSVTEIRKRYN